jgi:hypothetical protein
MALLLLTGSAGATVKARAIVRRRPTGEDQKVP